MCGIAGILSRAPGAVTPPEVVEQMLRPMGHRGPDGRGVHCDGPAGLGHVRLSIIDVAGGSQPMSNEDGTVWISFNGEIYNFRQLHDELVARGHSFRTHSDTEVIVHLYEEHGVQCLGRLRGMFAFAIWDSRRRQLLLARDRVGIKPLYYADDGCTLRFASEMKGILTAAAVDRDVHLDAVRSFFSFYYTPGTDTLVRGIRKLPAGHYLVADETGALVEQYWDLAFTTRRWAQPYEETVAELHDLLERTVEDHMIADVPVGVLLSGGVDSSAVLSFATRSSPYRVKAFTIGFNDAGVIDERPFARAAAQAFGAEHFEISITAEDFWAFLPRYVWHMEEPVNEPPAVALYYISKLASEHVKVVLSGEGGDEAFAGYPNYPNMLRADRMSRGLGPLSRPAGATLATFGRWLGLRRVERYAESFGRPLAQHYYSRSSGPTFPFNRRQGRCFTPWFSRATQPHDAPAMMGQLLRPLAQDPLLNQMLYSDTKTWLPDDLLVKADKMSMANSLELRVPLLDHEVLEFAASLPPTYKVRGRETKRVLKAAFAQALPAEILSRKKAGFPLPYRRWLRQELRNRVSETLLAEGAAIHRYIGKPEVRRLLQANARGEDYGAEIFCLLTLEFWHREFLAAAGQAR